MGLEKKIDRISTIFLLPDVRRRKKMDDQTMLLLCGGCSSSLCLLVLVLLVVFKKQVCKKVRIPLLCPAKNGTGGGTDTGTGTGGTGGEWVAAAGAGWKPALQTWYSSWPKCCKGSPAYDPSASKSECSDYSGCKYQGQMNDGTKLSYDQVKSTRFCSFTDVKEGTQWKGDSNPYWDSTYKRKYILVRKKGATKAMKMQIFDTCKNSDCGGCCTKNAKKGGGYLIDMESFTERAFNGGTKPVDEQVVEWKFA